MDRRNFLKVTMTAAAGALSGCGREFADNSTFKKKPNLLFVFTDQQSRDMLGCYGNQQIITPHLDEFAKDSIRFDHCVSSQPVCTPYRGMLLTGRHPLYNGCFSNDIQLLDTKGSSFAEVLKKHGYSTGYFGKWHLYGGDRERAIPAGSHRHGFDEFMSNNCHLNYKSGECFYFDQSGQKVYFDEWEPYGQTRQACDFLRRNADKPFAAFVSWHPPHDIDADDYPAKYIDGATKELLALYDPATINVRPNAQDTLENRKAYQGYMAMVTGIDKAFGELVEKIKELGLYDNTIIVFTSDHGDMLRSNKRMSPKSCPEVESVGVPLLIKLPQSLRENTASDLLIGSMDLMPTILSLLDIKPPQSVQGLDLAKDVLAGREDTVESVPIMYYAPAWRGVYTKRYTYARGDVYLPQGAVGFSDSANVLYDREKDLYELKNRFYDDSYKEIKEYLEGLNQKWLEKFGDEFWDEKYILKKLMNADSIGFFAKGRDGIMTKPDTMPIDILKNTH